MLPFIVSNKRIISLSLLEKHGSMFICVQGHSTSNKCLLCFHVNRQVSTLNYHTFWTFPMKNTIYHWKEIPLSFKTNQRQWGVMYYARYNSSRKDGNRHFEHNRARPRLGFHLLYFVFRLYMFEIKQLKSILYLFTKNIHPLSHIQFSPGKIFRWCLKIVYQKEKLLIMSNISYDHNISDSIKYYAFIDLVFLNFLSWFFSKSSAAGMWGGLKLKTIWTT